VVAIGTCDVFATNFVCFRGQGRSAAVRMASSVGSSGQLSSKSNTLHANNIILQEPGDMHSFCLFRILIFCCSSASAG
jgi:hypothetical protein